MTRKEYVMRALKALDEGRIDEDTYDAMLMNTNYFCDDEEDDEEEDKE